MAVVRLAAAVAVITEGYLAQHRMGKRGMKGPALLDVAQDYALQYLFQEGIFDLGVVLKGGTSLRTSSAQAALAASRRISTLLRQMSTPGNSSSTR